MRQPPIDYIERTRAQYAALGYPPYQWAVNDDQPPWQPLTKPLSECNLMLIASGGLYRLGQSAFHYRDDVSLRIINAHVAAKDLRVSHFAYDLTDVRQDHNVVFPLDALHQRVAAGQLGALSANTYTFMGGIYSARKVRDLIAPELLKRARQDEVDLALLVPA